MNCTPTECPHCHEWGPAVPGKVRCEKPPLTDGSTFRFSTSLGAKCQREDPLRLFDPEEER